MSSDVYKDFIRDLVYLIRETGAEARRRSAVGASDFDAGRAMAYVEILSLMQNQALAFQLPPEDLLLAGFDPETDSLDPPPPHSE